MGWAGPLRVATGGNASWGSMLVAAARQPMRIDGALSSFPWENTSFSVKRMKITNKLSPGNPGRGNFSFIIHPSYFILSPSALRPFPTSRFNVLTF
jgi:hypothetical protein